MSGLLAASSGSTNRCGFHGLGRAWLVILILRARSIPFSINARFVEEPWHFAGVLRCRAIMLGASWSVQIDHERARGGADGRRVAVVRRRLVS